VSSQTITCTLQNRLGALDRVLGALTHRGFVPEQLVSTLDPATGRIHLTVSFPCEEEKTVEKLIKFLNNQVTVLEARLLSAWQPAEPARVPIAVDNVAPLAAAKTERRLSHANPR
jgi:acetolactate synthase small subunit